MTLWRALAAVVLLAGSPLAAQQPAGELLIDPALEVIPLWPEGAPDTPESWVEPEYTGQHSVTFVTKPTLTVFPAAPDKATGAAMIVAPGGGFTGLAITKEGTMVAQWLAERGITALLLKYRVRPFFDENGAYIPGAPPAKDGEDPANRFEPNASLARADGMQAVKLVRAQAAKYGIAPDKVGFIGFSAGAMTAMNVTLAGDPASRPDYVLPIYGGMPDVAVPVDAPPAFILVARDDFLFERSVELFDNWTDAERPVEFHVYAKGGHGFGMEKQGLPVDHWPDVMEGWLVGQGLIAAADAP